MLKNKNIDENEEVDTRKFKIVYKNNDHDQAQRIAKNYWKQGYVIRVRNIDNIWYVFRAHA